MEKLDVNILIKQAPWASIYKEQIENIRIMRELHEGIPGVFQLDPKTSILDAIMVSDVLVSEESSTMCEAVMMGVPAISVCNWLIPDTTPSRYPADDYDYVIKTKKEELTECVDMVLKNYTKYQKEAQLYSTEHFANLGNCIPIMMDILDAMVEGRDPAHKSLIPKKRKAVGLKKLFLFRYTQFRRAMSYNYSVRNPFWRGLKKVYKRIKRRAE